MDRLLLHFLNKPLLSIGEKENKTKIISMEEIYDVEIIKIQHVKLFLA